MKANLFATLGPEVDGGIVLSGHTDMVPVADQDWTTEPFVMEERDGRLYGRGTCDMKGFIAAALAMAPRFAQRVSTSTCRNFETISSGFGRLFAILGPPFPKHSGGPVQQGRLTSKAPARLRHGCSQVLTVSTRWTLAEA